MLHWKEFTAWITVDDVEVSEYGVEVSEDENTVTCWVPSELGKKFTVNWTNTSASRRHPISGELEMDGTSSGSKIIYKPKTTTYKGIEEGVCVKPFMFSSLKLTDDDAFLGGQSLPKLGLIQLVILPVKVMQRNVPAAVYSLSDIKIHERSKKGVTQQISVAEPEFHNKPKRQVRSRRTGPNLATFSFRYRPIDVLRANGIAPPLPQLKRKASAELLRAQTPDDDIADAEEEKVLRERLRTLEAKRVKKEKKPRVKNETSDAVMVDLTQDSKQKVKMEERQPFIKGEVIDLT
ncbi:hypothetical protein DFH06DRAFT_1164302 [Mycena polygramma]|nr:hypothetical protein DFH06DRAFT_1164302 [Mycena polygramma]